MKSVGDLFVIEAMETYGGSFVKSLAVACRHADMGNLERIKKAFPEYWDEYTKIAMLKKPQTFGLDGSK